MRKTRSPAVRIAICEARSWSCHICGGRIDPATQKWELDHVIALASGGTDDDANLWPAHAKCHLSKTADDVTRIAKGKRITAKHLGAKARGWNTRFKKKVNGEVVPR